VIPFLPWKIVHVPVRKPLPGLSAEPGCGGLFVVFWCDDLPVGQLLIPSALLPLTPSQLAAAAPSAIASAIGNRLVRTAFPLFAYPQAEASPSTYLTRLLDLERPLEACAKLAPAATTERAPFISVVICTRNRPDALRKCLSSIRGLSPRPSEILVVDNDPSSGLTRATTAAFQEVRYVPETRPGLSAARNTGIRRCAGDIIAFTDDDAMVHPGWVGVLRAIFDDPGIIAATGLVLPAELATQAQFMFQGEYPWDYRAWEFDERFFRSWHRVGVPAWRLGAGANMAFRREAFDRVGVFDERLGAGAAGCSEDTELWYRLLAEGYRCRYEPAAVVFHTYRSDLKQLSDQTFSYMRGHVAALFFQFDRYRHWGNLYRALLALPFRFLALAFRALKQTILIQDAGADPPSVPLGPQIRGALAGYGYYLRYRWLPADREKPATPPAPEPTPSTRASNGRV
jgi:GT2 family glycosyltransferase